MDAFFDALPRFTNVHHLEFEHIPFSDYALSQLGLLKALNTLVVQDCNITARKKPSRRIRVSSVGFHSDCITYGSDDILGRVGWLDVLQPKHFRVIEIDLGQPKNLSLRGIASRKSMKNSSILEAHNVHHHIISILSRSLALEELRIVPFKRGYEDDLVDPPDDFELGMLALPSLRVYSGPLRFLSWFVPGPQFHTMTLMDSEKFHYVAEPATLLRSLLHLGSLEGQAFEVETLTLSTSGIPDVLLQSIGARFPRLKHLNLRAKRVDEIKVCL